MKTIALRFGEQFSPECGTIAAHQELIDKLGYVWYGKMGNPVSAAVIDELREEKDPRILLISSGKAERYWAHISEITRDMPLPDEIPEYYRDMADKFKTWIKITQFELAPKNIMQKCRVASSGNVLGEVSKHSMSPYFIIKYDDQEGV